MLGEHPNRGLPGGLPFLAPVGKRPLGCQGHFGRTRAGGRGELPKVSQDLRSCTHESTRVVGLRPGSRWEAPVPQAR